MIGYAVAVNPELASYRLRVAIPAPHMGLDYVIGRPAERSFFYKQGNPAVARTCGPVVFDVVNDHFDSQPSVGEMCRLASAITCGSDAMARTVYDCTGRDAVVIDDPYEMDEQAAACSGSTVAWFGHAANLRSLVPHVERLQGLRLVVCTNHDAPSIVRWTMDSERACLEACAVALLTGANRGASSNRVVKALRAGRFVVMPHDCPEAWRQFAPFVWVGNVREGVEWALGNRAKAVERVRAGQEYVRERFSPATIGRQWAAVFQSI